MDNKTLLKILGSQLLVGIIVVWSIWALVGNQSVQSLGGITNYDSLTLGENLIVGGTTSFTGGVTASGATTLSGTTTIAVSYDGLMVSKALSMATGTVQTVFTNTYGPMTCYGGTGSLYVKNNGSFSPSLQYTVGTSTTATLNKDNLLASTTIATSTTQLISLNAYKTILGSGQSIVAEIGDITNAEASSTYLGNLSAQVNIFCHLNQ